MTSEQEQRQEDYLNNKGTKCLFCKSGFIDQLDMEPDGPNSDRIVIDMRCLTCEKEWTEIYKLIGVEEV